MSSKVYFTKNISPESLIRLYEKLNIELPGKVAVKLHSGEKGNQNYVKPEFVKDIIEHVNGTVVETNTAYPGSERDETDKHQKVIEEHGWNKYFDVDIMDAEDDDIVFEIPNGKAIKQNFVGNHLKNYDSMLVLAHFKGHPAGGFGGALKQLSIGVASNRGKAWIHSAGYTKDKKLCWEHMPEQNAFLESMADAAGTVVNYFDGKMAFINMMVNLSVDCDCCSVAEDPCMKDVGILASLDPVAIDQACMDLIEKSDDPGKEHFMERVNSLNGKHTIEVAAEHGYGSRDCELINIDEE